jgi:hypothetical protein
VHPTIASPICAGHEIAFCFSFLSISSFVLVAGLVSFFFSIRFASPAEAIPAPVVACPPP